MIEIAQRLHPFSHTPGIECLIPTTSFIVRAFPALVRIYDFDGNQIEEVALNVHGPLKQFTCMQDLERGCVTLWSEQYRLHVLPDLKIECKKKPSTRLIAGEEISLGIHRKQEWEAVKKRGDMREIFPLWFRLGSLLDLPPFPKETCGTFALLKSCQEKILAHRPEKIIPEFTKLFLVGFRQLLIPRLNDDDHQGIIPFEEIKNGTSPLHLLHEGAKLIRSLFILCAEKTITFLPNLPPEFHAGRMLHVKTPIGEIDMEWTKKSIRRVIIRSSYDGRITLQFPPKMHTLRVRSDRAEKGKILSAEEPLEIKNGSLYLLDRFQK